MEFSDSQKEEKAKIETIKIILNENLPKPTKWSEEKISSFEKHKVVLGYLNAFFDHCPIKLSPNVIWQLILIKFIKYVNENSRMLRYMFVNFAGKKEIKVIMIDSLKDVKEYQNDLIEEFCSKISENVGNELANILTPNFSTSTKESIIAGKISIMSTFKDYFHYELNRKVCGIPYILLEGTLEDWKKILEKIKYLSKYRFDTKIMENDIIEIINAKEGKINYDFWRKIIMETKKTVRENYQCKYLQDVERDFITGWILDFYDEDDEIQKNELQKLNEEVIELDIEIKEKKSRKMGTATLNAGILDLKQDPNTYIVEPIVNYDIKFNIEQSEIDC